MPIILVHVKKNVGIFTEQSHFVESAPNLYDKQLFSWIFIDFGFGSWSNFCSIGPLRIRCNDRFDCKAFRRDGIPIFWYTQQIRHIFFFSLSPSLSLSLSLCVYLSLSFFFSLSLCYHSHSLSKTLIYKFIRFHNHCLLSALNLSLSLSLTLLSSVSFFSLSLIQILSLFQSLSLSLFLSFLLFIYYLFFLFPFLHLSDFPHHVSQRLCLYLFYPQPHPLSLPLPIALSSHPHPHSQIWYNVFF